MIRTRRALLRAAMVPLATPVAGLAARGASARQAFFELRAAPAMQRLIGPTRPQTAVWAFNGTVPGPVLRARAGERVRVRLVNAIDQPTSVHWHGVRIANAMDGVAGLTQAPVAPGASFEYDFVVPDAGSYWYHSHQRSWEQVERGLYGALIVAERDPPDIDRDLLLVFDDWRLEPGGALHERSFGNMHDSSHDGRLGNWLTVNGRDRPELAVGAGERVRLRLMNTSNARVLEIDLPALEPTLVALDGHPVTPREMVRPVELAPGQRADLVVDIGRAPGTRLAVEEVSYSERYMCAELLVGEGTRDGRPRREPVAPLERRSGPALDLRTAAVARLLMTGGAMGSLRSALLGGRELGIRELVSAGRVWAFNGVAGDLDRPLLSARKGQTVRIDLVNDTRWPHAMHLHGHHFLALRDDRPERAGDWRDTELMAPGERLSIAFVADNPGKWLLHCHMLEHQAAGMRTWVEVGA